MVGRFLGLFLGAIFVVLLVLSLIMVLFDVFLSMFLFDVFLLVFCSLLGLSFIVDIDIPKHIKTITLSYTLFDITEAAKATGVKKLSSDKDLSSAKRLPDPSFLSTLVALN